MITRDRLVEVGEIFKPHGIKGEVTLTLDAPLEPADLRCFILQIDGLFVPFFAESVRPRGAESWLVKMDGVDNERDAAALARHKIYTPADELPEGFDEAYDDGIYLYDLIGYTLTDTDGTEVGVIDNIDDSTANVLLHVTTASGTRVFVPFADELMTDIDTDNRRLSLNIPDGILDLN